MWARRAATAGAERFLTLTVKPDWHVSPRAAYEALKTEFSKFVTWWRKTGGSKTKPRPRVFEYMAIWEIQPQTGYPHLHILQKGDFCPESLIRRWMRNAKIGENVGQKIKKITSGEGAARYVVKYSGKAAGDMKRLLGRNRLIQASRHFFVPELEDPSDKPLFGFAWTWLRVSAATALLTLINYDRYKLDPENKTSMMILQPTDCDYDLERLAYGIDPSIVDDSKKYAPPQELDLAAMAKESIAIGVTLDDELFVDEQLIF